MIKYIKKKKNLIKKIFYYKPLSFNKLKKKINNSDALILFFKKGKNIYQILYQQKFKLIYHLVSRL